MRTILLCAAVALAGVVFLPLVVAGRADDATDREIGAFRVGNAGGANRHR